MHLWVPSGSHFGAVVHDVLKAPYHVNDTVTVTFQSACPRNNVRTGDTFLAVQKLQEDSGEWTTVNFFFHLIYTGCQVSQVCTFPPAESLL